MIGRMDQRITFQRLVEVQDGIGGVTKRWQEFEADPVVWAEVKVRPGREVMVEGRMTAQSPTTFKVWHRSDVNELDRIIWQGSAYQIRNILRHGGRALTLEIDAERGAAQ